MKIAILGYGEQGRSAYEYWKSSDNEITICDQNEETVIPDGAKSRLGMSYLDDLSEFDMLVRGPSVHPNDIQNNNQGNPKILDKFTTVTDEFMKVCPAPIIGVTGTKGKGTTSSLITAILKTAGKTVHLGGNIGIPPLDMLKNKIKPTDIVVLELANFQLIDLKHSPQIAVCLMVAPEHLNWHSGMNEYIGAKQQLFRYQKSGDLAVYNRANSYSEQVVSVSGAKKLSYEVPPLHSSPVQETDVFVKGNSIYIGEEKICDIDDVKLLGRHNLENVCAAIATTWELIGRDKKIIQTAIKSFSGLPYRIEIIREIDGIKFVNDSFGTTPETAIVAIQAFKEPKILILGGSDKNADFSELADEIAMQNVKYVVAIGQTGPKIIETLKTKKPDITYSLLEQTNMSEIVQTAISQSVSGDVILLSTACASFGMFENYKDRGDQFNSVVKQL